MTEINITQTNFKDTLLFLEKELQKLVTNDVTKIITNGNIILTLQDIKNCIIANNSKKLEKGDDGPKHILFGELFNAELYIDPLMRWDDNRIILKNDEKIIEEILLIDDNNMLI